ncbi:ThiF family adenylyltransferase, partial [Frankia sp. AgPm24]|uniref:shikimate dehydrogenase family protein n=1 Tax=Frankia sp. AgPm24 TaxID=631128 RepID=UPI0020104254
TPRAPAAPTRARPTGRGRPPGGGGPPDNFDGAGFVRGLARAGQPLEGTRVALMGAGGAGSAIAVALLGAGCRQLAIHDPDQAKCADLVARLDVHWPGRVTRAVRPALADADLAVNATPLGLRPDDPLPFPPEALPAGALVADIIMKPARTRLLDVAGALGLRTHPGIPMLAEQVDLYREFFGLTAPGGGDVAASA